MNVRQAGLPSKSSGECRMRAVSRTLRRLWGLPLLLALIAFAMVPPAHASTLFQFTAQDVMNGLSGTTNYSLSGYYTVFLQIPDGYTLQLLNAPQGSNSDSWEVWPDVVGGSALGASSSTNWVGFTRDYTQSNVMLLHDTATTLAGQSYQEPSPGNPPPIYWGSSLGTVVEIMSPTAQFAFESSAPTPYLSGQTATFSAAASPLWWAAPYPSFLKDSQPTFFDLTVTAGAAAPEPGTFGFVVFGALSITLRRYWRKA